MVWKKILWIVILCAIVVVVFLYGYYVHSRENVLKVMGLSQPHLTTVERSNTPSLAVPLPVHPDEQFTIVMQTYHREGLLRKILPHYCNMSLVSRILVIWNNVNTSVPQDLYSLECARAKLIFLHMQKNTVRNRFQPFPEIQTEAVLVLDDDRWIAEADIHLAFRVWKANRHLIVSFDGRRTEKINGSYEYRVNLNTTSGKSYSMLLAGEAFFHIGYLSLYNTTLPQTVYELIDMTQNCDDIAMNVMVADYLERNGQPQCPGIVVRGYTVKNIETEEKSGFEGLWKRATHKRVRATCLNRIARAYGDLPLQYYSTMLVRHL